MNSADPRLPWRLNENDRQMLKSFRISIHDPAAIAAVREADEQRFNPPRQHE